MDTQFGKDGKSGLDSGTVGKITEQVGDAPRQIKAAAVDFGRKTVDTLDAQRGPAAVALDRTAAALHERGENVAGAARATAERLKATADYVREHDMKAMAADVRDLVRRYPGPSLAVAAAAGFLFARVLRSQD